MPITTVTSRAFNQDASKAKHASELGPVVITDRGRPAHVLLTYADYKKLASQRAKVADLLALSGAEHIELFIPPMRELAKAADLP
jgi:prevent-host-death family protein